MGRSADPALQPAPLAGLDETANAEILGQFVPSLATMPEIQVQRNARVIQVRKRDLPRSWDALPLAASEIAGVPSLWATAKAAERWLVKNPPEAQRDIIRVWGLLAHRPLGQTSWSKALVGTRGRSGGGARAGAGGWGPRVFG